MTIDATHLKIDARLLPEENMQWGTLKWLCNESLSPGAHQTIGCCKIFPGCSNPIHYHPNCEETLWVMQGQGVHSLDDRQVELEAGVLLRIPVGVKHHFCNTGTSILECLITFSSGDRQTVFV